MTPSDFYAFQYFLTMGLSLLCIMVYAPRVLCKKFFMALKRNGLGYEQDPLPPIDRLKIRLGVLLLVSGSTAISGFKMLKFAIVGDDAAASDGLWSIEPFLLFPFFTSYWVGLVLLMGYWFRRTFDKHWVIILIFSILSIALMGMTL